MLTTNNVGRPLEISLKIPVKTYDIDFAGIVSNIVYVKWLEDLRLQFLAENLPIHQQLEQGYAPIISGTEITYKRPIKLIDEVIGCLWLASLGKLKWIVQAEILSNNELAAFATQKGAFVNLQNSRLIPIPERLQQKYATYKQTQ